MRWRDEQIETTALDGIGVQRELALLGGEPEQLHEGAAVLVVTQHGLAMLCALADQMGQTGNDQARQTGHGERT